MAWAFKNVIKNTYEFQKYLKIELSTMLRK